jgi:hypothetical protein
MTLRPPKGNARPAQVVALDYEIAQEQASALGRLGRALEAALGALAAALGALANYDGDIAPVRHAQPQSGDETERATRARLVQQASEALWYFMVQREACGLRDPRPVIREYRVPAEVYARMGIVSRR